MIALLPYRISHNDSSWDPEEPEETEGTYDIRRGREHSSPSSFSFRFVLLVTR